MGAGGVLAREKADGESGSPAHKATPTYRFQGGKRRTPNGQRRCLLRRRSRRPSLRGVGVYDTQPPVLQSRASSPSGALPLNVTFPVGSMYEYQGRRSCHCTGVRARATHWLGSFGSVDELYHASHRMLLRASGVITAGRGLQGANSRTQCSTHAPQRVPFGPARAQCNPAARTVDAIMRESIPRFGSVQ